MRTIEIPPKYGLIGSFFLLIVVYSLFQARFIILGPNLRVDAPRDGQLVEPAVTVRGHGDNIAFLSLNDRPIYMDKNGDWSEELIVPKGLSIMTLRARDRFGREKERELKVVVN